MLVNIENKQHRKIVESSIISNNNTMKQNIFFQLVSLFSQISAKNYEIPYLNQLDFINDLYLYSLFNVF